MLDSPLWPKGFGIDLHLPPSASRESPVLVAVHGISRNSSEHLAAFAAEAGEDCVVVVPRFPRETFPNYQRLGLGSEEPRADIVLDAALERVAQHNGLSLRRFHLFGFSGGAQFAHRYAMMHPARIMSLHLAAAGWYTFADPATSWPRGLGRTPQGRQITANLARFLAIPTHLYVGEKDTERDANLRQEPTIDAQQGWNRKERAQRWAAHLNSLRASSHPRTEVEILPATGHDFLEACAPPQGRLAERVLAACMSVHAASQSRRYGSTV